MSFVRNFAALTISLGLLVASGCKPDAPPGASNPPGEADATQAGGPGSDTAVTQTEGGEPVEGGGEPAAAACEPAVAGAPVPLFNEKVLIRPPLNVELVEDNPTVARTFATAGFVSACDATVDQMWLFVFENDPKQQLGQFVDDFINSYLHKSGYQNGDRGDNIVSSDTDIHAVVEYPPGGGKPAQSLYVAASRKDKNVFVAVYVTRPAEFAALKPTFKKSAESILVVPD